MVHCSIPTVIYGSSLCYSPLTSQPLHLLPMHHTTLTHFMNNMSSLSDLLDIHAPMITKRLIKPPSWIVNEFRTARYLHRKHERTLRRNKSPVNRASLRWQINRCNHLQNKNKEQYYQDLVKENCGDGVTLWCVLRKVLAGFPVLPFDTVLMKSHLQTGLVHFYRQSKQIRNIQK